MRANSTFLDAGSLFPALRVQTVGGALLSLPVDLAHEWTVVLLNRGHW